MPKIKTHRGAAKRFKVTGTGKIVRAHAYKRHLLASKTAKRKRGLRKSAVLSSADQAKTKLLVPYL